MNNTLIIIYLIIVAISYGYFIIKWIKPIPTVTKAPSIIKSIQVIRIETEEGLGLFKGRDKLTNKVELTSNQNLHLNYLDNRHQDKFPAPHEDKGIEIDISEDNYFCAFKSIKQIQEWIKPKEFEVLFVLGHKVYLLTVTNYLEGKYQVVYTRDSVISQECISNLF